MRKHFFVLAVIVGVAVSGGMSCGTSKGKGVDSSCSATLPSGTTPVVTPVAVPLTGCTTTDYSVAATVGGQANLKLIVDSGSTIMALAGSGCSNCSGISPTYPESHGQNLCTSLSQQYGGGYGWQGPTYQDQVLIGYMPTISNNFVSIDYQTLNSQGDGFFLTSDCSNGATGLNSYQGILGMAFSGGTVAPAVGYLDALQQQAGIADLFATQLCMSGGMLWFGQVDPTYYSGSIQYTPITPPAGDPMANVFYWVTLSDVKVNGVSVGQPASAYGNTIVDTGTSIALLPTAVYNAIISSLSNSSALQAFVGGNAAAVINWFNNGANGLTGDPSNLPALTLVLKGVSSGTISVTIPAAKSYLDAHVVNGVTTYFQGIAPNSSQPAIIGGSFLRSLITVFDRAGKQVGFATEAKCGNN